MAAQSSDGTPSRVDPLLNRVEQVIYVAIALLLMVAAAALLFDAAREFVVQLAEPFLIVGLIAGIRSILVITAEAWHLGDIHATEFDRAMLEIGLLTVLTLALVTCIILLRRSKPTVEEVATEEKLAG